MKGQDTRLGVPSKGDVLAWSEAQSRWVKVNVRYVRANPAVYPRWVACKDAGRATQTVPVLKDGEIRDQIGRDMKATQTVTAGEKP